MLKYPYGEKVQLTTALKFICLGSSLGTGKNGKIKTVFKYCGLYTQKSLCYVYSALYKYTIVFNRGDDSSNKTTPKYSEKRNVRSNSHLLPIFQHASK